MATPRRTTAKSLPGLTLTTLGGAELARADDTGRTVLLGAGKPLALLVYLSAHPDQPVTREHLLDKLWDNLEPEQGRHALRQLLLYLRQRIDEPLLEATRDTITLTAALSSDRGELLAAAERRDFEAVVATYKGVFLPDFALPGGGGFEQWADLERGRLRATFLRCGDALARRWLSEGRQREAVALARRLRDSDRGEESSWRLLIEALLSANDYFAAGTEADAFTRHWASEEREPHPSTLALLRRATAAPIPTSATATTTLTSEMVGRAEEFGKLIVAAEAARSGKAAHVHVTAPAGIGKTRLLTDFANRLRAKGARVAFLAARPGDRLIAQATMSDLAAALAAIPGAAGISPLATRSLVALHPALSSRFRADADSAQGDEAVRRRTIALHELMGAVAEEAPLTIIIDDLHWMDDVSQRMLANILQRVGGERLLVVTASRPRYSVASAPHTVDLELRSLTLAQVGALLSSIAAMPDPDFGREFSERLHRATDGSPLLVLETIQLLIERELLAIGDAWTTRDLAGLWAALAAGKALAQRINLLAPTARRLLTHLAIAGVPMEPALSARALGMDATDVEREAGALEQRGLLHLASGRWTIAHDSIAEQVIEHSSADDVRSAHGQIGRALATTPGSDLRRAARHLADAGDSTILRHTFHRWLAAVRNAGEVRGVRELASDFVGPGDGGTVELLARSAPLHLRVSRRSMIVSAIGAAAVILVSVIVRSTSSASEPPPDALLYAVHAATEADSARYEIPIRRSALSVQTPVELRRMRRHEGFVPRASYQSHLSLDGRRWTFDRVVRDTGSFDIFVADARTGAERRLTFGRTDDLSPAWSPDGRFIAFATGRFNDVQHPNIAVLDPGTGDVRQVTATLASDFLPKWHPAGTRIGFSRKYWDTERPKELCTVAVDGTGTDCFVVQGGNEVTPLGWYDDERMLVQVGAENDQLYRYAVVNVITREVRRLGDHEGGYSLASPDGKFIVCYCRSLATPKAPPRFVVFPVDQPDVWQEIILSATQDSVFRVTFGGVTDARYASRLSIDAPHALPLGVESRLFASATDPSGRPVKFLPLTWQSLSPDIARIDSSGLLTPLRSGEARIRVSAGGWIATERTVTIAAPQRRELLSESWAGGLEANWKPYGEPRPFVADVAALGRAVRLNGDKSFSSGVYTTRGYDASEGLVVEAEVSSPITSSQWQTIAVEFVSADADEALASWDHSHGGPPFSGRTHARATCVIGLPDGEGPSALKRWNLVSNVAVKTPLQAEVLTGKPYTIVLALRPDGSCQAKVGTQAPVLTRGPAPARGAYRVAIYGMSSGTAIAVGRVRIMSGIVPGGTGLNR